MCIRDRTKRCSREQILNALGLTARDLILDEGYTRIDRLPNGAKVHTVGKKPQVPKVAGDGLGKLTNTYDYTDSDGTVLFQVCRFEKLDADGKKVKTFRQRQYRPDDPKAKNGYVWSVSSEVRTHSPVSYTHLAFAAQNAEEKRRGSGPLCRTGRGRNMTAVPAAGAQKPAAGT